MFCVTVSQYPNFCEGALLVFLDVRCLSGISIAARSSSPKILVNNRVEYHKKMSVTFCLSEISRERAFSGVFKTEWYQIDYAKPWWHNFLWIFFDSTELFSRGNFLGFWKFLVWKCFLYKWRVTIFCRKFFVSLCQKFSSKGSFGVREYLLTLGINCTCVIWNIMPGKTKRCKTRKFAVILELIKISYYF